MTPSGAAALRWLTPEGGAMTPGDWERGDRHALAIVFEAIPPASNWLVLVNAEERDLGFTLPPGRWLLQLASDTDDALSGAPLDGTQVLRPGSLWVAKT